MPARRSPGGANGEAPLIGEGFGAVSGVRVLGLPIDPVTVGSATEPMAAARPSSADWRRASVSSSALELFLVEELAAGDAVDPRAHLGDAVLIGELHFRLAGDQPRQDVVVESEIGGGDDRPAAHDHQRTDDGPERHRPETDLTAAVTEGEIGLRQAAAIVAVRVFAPRRGFVVFVVGDVLVQPARRSSRYRRAGPAWKEERAFERLDIDAPTPAAQAGRRSFVEI